MHLWIPAPEDGGILTATYGTQAFQSQTELQVFSNCYNKQWLGSKFFHPPEVWTSAFFPHFPLAASEMGSLIMRLFTPGGYAVVPKGKPCVQGHFPPSRFWIINYSCQHLGTEAFLIHARMTEKLIPVSDSFHSSVRPQVPILKVAIQITPQSTRLDAKDAY